MICMYRKLRTYCIQNAYVYIMYFILCDITVDSKKCYKPITVTLFQLSQNLPFSIYDTFNAVIFANHYSFYTK